VNGRRPFCAVSLLGAIISGGTTLGLNGQIPVFSNAFFYERQAQRSDVGHTIDCKKCFLRDLPSVFLPLSPLLRPALFEDAEDDNIKTLIYMGGVGWIAENMDAVLSGIVKELKGVVGVMAIDNKEACMTVGPLCCVSLEVGKPEYSQFTICPPFF